MTEPAPPIDLELEPGAPEVPEDAYAGYEARRALGDVIRLRRGTYDLYWVLGYDEAAAVLRDPRFSAQRPIGDTTGEGVPPAFRRLGELLGRMMLLRDAPDHTRLRGLVGKAFTPRVVQNLRPRIEVVVADLLADVGRRGRMDAIRDLATPLPVVVIAELMGIPTVDQGRFKQWSDAIAVVLDGSIRAAGLPRAAKAVSELSDYLGGVIRRRRLAPGEDLLSRLVVARDREDALTEDELIANAILILLAGHETTTNLIGNGMLALAEHPAEQAKLKRRPELAAGAVEEMLRYDPPIQFTSRETREPVDVLGHRFEPGIEVCVILAAANRDPAQFRDPLRFDVERTPNRHLSFGMGAHFCLGAPLARLEAEVAFEALARRLPAFKVEGEPRRRAGAVLRGLESLPVVF